MCSIVAEHFCIKGFEYWSRGGSGKYIAGLQLNCLKLDGSQKRHQQRGFDIFVRNIVQANVLCH